MLPQVAKVGGFAIITKDIRLRQLCIFTGTLVKTLGPSGKKTKPFRVKAVYPNAGDQKLIFDVKATDLFALPKKPGQLLFELLQKTVPPVCICGSYVMEMAKIFEAVYNSPLGDGIISEQGMEPHFPFAIPEAIATHLLKFSICQREIIDGKNKLIFPLLIKRPV